MEITEAELKNHILRLNPFTARLDAERLGIAVAEAEYRQGETFETLMHHIQARRIPKRDPAFDIDRKYVEDPESLRTVYQMVYEEFFPTRQVSTP